MQTNYTSVRIKNISAFTFCASIFPALSLSITASDPFNRPFSDLITGIPPPPLAITIIPLLTKHFIASSYSIPYGSGEATTLLQFF